MALRFFKWVVFGILLALVPLGADALQLLTNHRPGSPPVVLPDQVIAKGELLIVIAGMAGAALGELFGEKAPRFPRWRVFVGGLTLIVVVVAEKAGLGESYAGEFR